MRKRGNLWKCIMALFFIIIVSTGLIQDTNEKIWDANSPLTWNDYKRPDKDKTLNAQSSAVTSNAIPFRYRKLGADSNSYIFEFQVKNAMYRNSSWVNPEYRNPALLAHEQLHFDISEYFARQLLRTFQSATYSHNFKKEIQDIKLKNVDQVNTMQKLYDEQTIHSQNTSMQLKWNMYVQSLLQSNESIENAVKRLPKLVQ